MTTDPILDEIHRIRREMSDRFDGDFVEKLDMATDIDPDFARRKLDGIFALHEVGRDLLFAGARHDFPQKSNEELWRIVAERAARRRRGKWGHNEPKR